MEITTNSIGYIGMSEEILDKVRAALGKIKYGSVEIIIHDSKIVQIESRERIRLDKKKE